MDLTTSTSTMTPRLAIDNNGESVDSALVAALASAVGLHSWPDLKAIPASIVQIHSSSAGNGDRRAYVEVHPQSPLPDMWYAVRIAAVPQGLSWPRYPAFLKMPDGAFLIRFRPGSDPQLWAIAVCEKPGGVQLLRLIFSERVVASIPLDTLVQLSQGARKLHLSIVDQPSVPAGGTVAVLAISDLDTSKTAAMAASLDFMSISGKKLTPLNGASTVTKTFVHSALPDWGTGCRRAWP